MKKFQREKALNAQLKRHKEAMEKWESKRLSGEKVDMKACREYDRAYAQYKMTQKKMNFLRQGKSYLGETLGYYVGDKDN